MATAVSDVITYARQKAQTDSNGISDTLGLAWATDALIDITRDLIKRNIDAAQIQESYATISPSDSQPGRFPWPSDMFALKTVEVNFVDSSQNNYIQASKVDVANLQGATSFDFLRKNQDTNNPQFTNHGDTGEAFPTITAPALIRIFYFLTPTPYSATSTNLSYPQTLDYTCLGDKMLQSYYESLEKFDIAAQWKASYEKKVNDIINILAPQSQQPIQAERLHITGWEF